MFKNRNNLKAKKTAENGGINKEFNEGKLRWYAQEHELHERGLGWYIFMGLAIMGMLLWAVLSENWTFALLIVAVTALYSHYEKEARSGDNLIEVVLSDIGIKAGKRRYPFSNISGFWVVYEQHIQKALYIQIKNNLYGEVEIMLGDQNPERIKRFLRKRIPEIKNKSISITKLISKLLKI